MRVIPGALAALGVLLGCASQEPQALAGAEPAPVLAAIPVPYIPSPSPAQLSTTDPAIFMSNLDARIEGMRQRLAATDQPWLRLQLAANLLQRHEIRGGQDDLLAARRIAEAVPPDTPYRADALLLLARMDMAIHHFAAARDRVEEARRLGGDAARASLLEATIERGTGGPGSLIAPDLPHATPQSLAFEANRLVEKGDPHRAVLLLVDAQRRYQDTNPLPLAWLQVQQGIVYLRYQRYREARALFEAAWQRLPDYYLAAEHLAETELLLGNAGRAAELYRQVVRQTGDPVFYAALADAETVLGNRQAARQARRQAEQGFEQQLSVTPEAAYAHAAAYYLDRGDGPRARALATANAEHRSDPASLLLLAEAALATNRREDACRQLDQVRALGVRSPEMLLLEVELAGCRT